MKYFLSILIFAATVAASAQTPGFKANGGAALPFVTTLATNQTFIVDRGGGLSPVNIRFDELQKALLKFASSNYSMRFGANPETPGYSSNSITFSNGVIRFDTSYALERGIAWGGYTANGYFPGYIQFGNTTSGGSFLLRAGDIGIESPKDFSSIRLTDDHRLDGLVKISGQTIGGLAFPSNNFSGMLAFQSPITNGGGTYIPGYSGFRGKNATGIEVFKVDGESWSQSEVWGYTLIPPPFANSSGGYRIVGDTNWFIIGTTNASVVKGLTVASNAISQWPSAARTPGDVMLVNSNGSLFCLTTTGFTTEWTATNLIAAAVSATDPDAEKFFTASGLSDTAQKSAVTTLVKSMKSASLWTKMQAVYPFVGGTSNTHSWNLKDTNVFRVAWTTSGVTHNANGITGNGSSGYGNTQYNPTTSGGLNSQHISIYCKTQTPTDAGHFLSGATGVAGDQLSIFRNGVNASSIVNAAAFNDIAGSTDSRGFFCASRMASAGTDAMNNNLRGATQQYTSASVARPNTSLFLLARNWPDYGTDAYTTANLAFATIGSGLTASESDALRLIVENFETEIGR